MANVPIVGAKGGLLLAGTNSGQSLSSPHKHKFDFGTDDFTHVVWFYWTLGGEVIQRFANKWAGSIGTLQKGFSFGLNDGYPYMAMADGIVAQGIEPFVQTNVSITPGKWSHVAFVKQSQTAANWRIYVNGAPQAVTRSGAATLTGTLDNTDPLYIGRGQNGAGDLHFFFGALYDIRFYRRALTALEISELWKFPTKDTFLNKIAHYRLNLGSGRTVPDVLNPADVLTLSYGYTDAQIGAINPATNSVWLASLSTSTIPNTIKPNAIMIGRLANGIRSVDGQNHIIRVPKAASLDFQVGSSFTISAWLVAYYPDPTFGIQLYSNNELDGPGYFFLLTATSVHIALRDQNGFKRNMPINLSVPFSTRIHVAGTVSGNNPANWRNYINGSPLPSGTVVNDAVTNTLSSRDGFIGTYSVGNHARGTKDIFNLQIFNKALSDAEIAFLFKQEGTIPASALDSSVADWKFTEKSGTVLKDHSSYANNGYFENWQGLTDLNGTLGPENSWVDAYSLQPKTS